MKKDTGLAVVAVVAVISLVLVLLAYTARTLPSRLSSPLSVKSMKKYIINLDRRGDRMAVTVPKLSSFGFTDVERWPAIDARRMHRSEVDSLVRPEDRAPIWSNRRTKHSELSIGAVGCYLSHVQIWASLDRDHVVIFEDDTNPTLTADEVDAVLTDLPSDWDILFLGVWSQHHDRSKGLSVQRLKRFYGMHAYIINTRCVSSLLKIALPMRMQIDSWLSELAIHGSLRIYTIANSGWVQNTSINATDIQTPVSLE